VAGAGSIIGGEPVRVSDVPSGFSITMSDDAPFSELRTSLTTAAHAESDHNIDWVAPNIVQISEDNGSVRTSSEEEAAVMHPPFAFASESHQIPDVGLNSFSAQENRSGLTSNISDNFDYSQVGLNSGSVDEIISSSIGDFASFAVPKSPNYTASPLGFPKEASNPPFGEEREDDHDIIGNYVPIDESPQPPVLIMQSQNVQEPAEDTYKPTRQSPEKEFSAHMQNSDAALFGTRARSHSSSSSRGVLADHLSASGALASPTATYVMDAGIHSHLSGEQMLTAISPLTMAGTPPVDSPFASGLATRSGPEPNDIDIDPSVTTLPNNIAHIASLSSWMTSNADVVPTTANKYAEQLIGAGVGTLKRLSKKLAQNSNYLESELHFDRDDAEDIVSALKKLGFSVGSTDSSVMLLDRSVRNDFSNNSSAATNDSSTAQAAIFPKPPKVISPTKPKAAIVVNKGASALKDKSKKLKGEERTEKPANLPNQPVNPIAMITPERKEALRKMFLQSQSDLAGLKDAIESSNITQATAIFKSVMTSLASNEGEDFQTILGRLGFCKVTLSAMDKFVDDITFVDRCATVMSTMCRRGAAKNSISVENLKSYGLDGAAPLVAKLLQK
jgi:hypothetical protein